MSQILYLQRLDVSSGLPDHAMEDGVSASTDAARLAEIAMRFAEVTRAPSRYIRHHSGIRTRATDDRVALEIPLPVKDSIGRACVLLVLSDLIPNSTNVGTMAEELTVQIGGFLRSLDEITTSCLDTDEVLNQRIYEALERVESEHGLPLQKGDEQMPVLKSIGVAAFNRIGQGLRNLTDRVNRIGFDSEHSSSASEHLPPDQSTSEK
jgi:hypothetical protein